MVPHRTAAHTGYDPLSMRDVEQPRDGTTEYECLQCGIITGAEASPGRCPNCGGEMRNRQMPLE